jgi:PAS domain S-box-containing protein
MADPKQTASNRDPSPAEQRLEAHYEVTRALAEALSLKEASPRILQIICAVLGWEAGLLWLADPAIKKLRCEESWHLPTPSALAFVEASRTYTFLPGEGLPGRVWQSAKAFSVADLVGDTQAPRARLAASEGIHGVMAFPILFKSEVMGVMEFFSLTARSADDPQLKLMSAIGSQLGLFADRKRTERALRDSEEQYRLLAATAADAMITIDAQGVILFANPATQQVFGYSPGELAGKKLTTIMPERLRALHEAGFARYMRTGVKTLNWRGIEIVGLHKTGREFPVEASFGEFQREGARYLTGIIRDISKRKQAEDARRQAVLAVVEAEARFRAVADSAPVLLWMSGPDKLCTYFNKSWLAFTGKTLAQEQGNGWAQGVHADDTGRCMDIYTSAFDRREEFKMEYRLRRHDGQFRWIVDNGIPLHSPDGNFAGYIGSCIDIHDRKEQELREKSAREEAEKVTRLKDEFLSTVSHELRTPLTPIIGWARMLRAYKLDEKQFQHGLEVIERNAQSQAALIEDLLDVSRIISGKLIIELKPVNLTQVIESAIESLRSNAEAKHIQVGFVTESDPGAALADKVRMQQVIWNLLGNAIKFSHFGGRVEIRLGRRDSRVFIAVSDNGVGLTPQFLPHVFDRFSQADASTTRKFGGLGIGLSIVRHLVLLHNGTVEACSPGLGCGTTFTVFLPMPATRLPAVSSTPSAGTLAVHGRSQKLSGLSVLVVEDEDDAREFISFVLTQNGARVRGLASSAEALESLKSFTPDVILCDIGMTVDDGYVFIGKLRESGSTIPAVALTAFARLEDRNKALQAGFQQHLSKPVESEVLIDLLALMGQKR